MSYLNCERCNKGLNLGEKYRIISGQPYCRKCYKKEKRELIRTFDKRHPIFVVRKSDKF